MKALVVLGSLALVGIVAVAAWMNRSHRAESDRRDRETVAGRSAAEGTAAATEVERLRAELAREKGRADAAERALAALEAGSGKPGAGAAKSTKPAKAGDLKTRADASWEERVKSVDWKKDVKTLVAYMKELKDAEAEGRAPKMTPAMIAGLTSMQVSIQKLARELGLEESEWMKVYSNPVVGRHFSDAYAVALAGAELEPDQLERLHATMLFDPDREPTGRGGGALGEWAAQMEWNQLWVLQTRGILSAEQQANLERTLSPTFMVNGYTQQGIQAPSAEAAGRSVADYWMQQWKLPEGSGTALEPLARQYAADHAALVRQYAAEYGSTLTRDREIELQLKLIELQIAAERRVAESLPLDAESLKRVQSGSGRALRISLP